MGNQIVADAEKYEAEDEEKRKTIQAKNELENMAYQMRNTLDDAKFKDMIKDDDKKKVQDMRVRGKRLKRYGDRLLLLRMDRVVRRVVCPVVCLVEWVAVCLAEWVVCLEWEISNRHQAVVIPVDQRLMKSIKRLLL